MTDKWYNNVKKTDTPKRARVSKGTLVKAIKENCLECGGGSQSERRLCTVEHCKLWPFRLGVSLQNIKEASASTLALEKAKHTELLKKLAGHSRRKASPTNP